MKYQPRVRQNKSRGTVGKPVAGRNLIVSQPVPE
jgi:hypothetical protein